MNKKLIAIVSCALLFTGCVQVSGTKTADGNLKVTTHRFMWASQNIDFSVKDEKGFTTNLKVEKSNVDSAALAAAAEGIVKGLTATAK